MPVERAFQPTDPLSPAELEAILETAYVVVSADRTVREEEIEAIEAVAVRLGEPGPRRAGTAPAPSPEALAQLLDVFSERLQRDGAEKRLEAIAAALPRPTTRALAYRVACALSLSDLDTHDREFELDLSLIAAFGLPQETADELAAEVHESLAAVSSQ